MIYRSCGTLFLLGVSIAAQAQVSYTWTDITPPVAYADVYEIVTHPLDGRKLLISGYFGFLGSDDAGATWTKRASGGQGLFSHIGLPGTVFSNFGGLLPPYRGAFLPPGDAAPGSTYRSDDFGQTWRRVNTSPANALSFAPLGSDPADVNHIFGTVRSQFGCGSIFLGCRFYDSIAVAQSHDGASTWEGKQSGIPGSLDPYQTIDVDAPTPAAPARLFAAVGNSVYVTRDSAATWTPLDVSSLGPVRSIRADPRRANVLYAIQVAANSQDPGEMGLGRILRSDDEGATWKAIFLFDNYWPYPNVKPRLVVDPVRSDEIWLYGLESGVHHSEDGGKTWTLVASAARTIKNGSGEMLPDYDDVVETLVLSPADPGVVYGIRASRLYRGVPSTRSDPVIPEFQYEGNRYWNATTGGEALSQDYRMEPGHAHRTGQRFGAWRADDAPLGSQGSCRFWPRPETGLRTRVITIHDGECEYLKHDPGWILEAENEFFAMPPNAAGRCAAGLVSVRRFNNVQADLNHRWVSDAATANEMRARGWYDEGVRFCARPLGANE